MIESATTTANAVESPRNVWQAVKRGVLGRCPSCGEGRLFRGFLKATPACSHCGESYDQLSADDMPPWLTILIVGHVIVPLLLYVEMTWHPEMWIQMAVWPALTAAMMLAVLPRAKGVVLAVLWATGAEERREPSTEPS